MSLCKSLSGRRRESLIWDFFEYDEARDKSRCRVLMDKGEKHCDAQLTGKNPTNLSNHLAGHS